MAEFKPIRDKTIVERIVEVDGKPTVGLFIHDVSLVTGEDIAIQKDRLQRNDDIVQDLFVYVRELRALGVRNIPIADVIQKLRIQIIADYPTQVRDV